MSKRTSASPARLTASLLIATALHIAVLVGVDWPAPPEVGSTPTIHLSLTGYRSPPANNAPPQRDAANELNAQRGEPTPIEPPQPTPPPGLAEPDPPPPGAAAPSASPIAGRSVAALARAIASSAARTRPTDAGSRTFRLTNGATTSVDFAYYLDSWRRKVERIGQLNYPQQAKQQGIAGSLRLFVAISADGALRDVRVLASSGHPLLDDAALRIVRLAAPYAPFSPTMREAADVLEIERTWQFRNSRLSS